jgi:hypothetical protein
MRVREQFKCSVEKHDKAIIATRRILLQAAKTVLEGGDPPGIDTSYYSIRAVERVLPDGVDCHEALKAEVNPIGR